MTPAAILTISILLGVVLLIALWLRLSASRDRLIGFLEYVRNPHLRARMGSVIEERDRIVAQLAEWPPEELVELLLDDARHEIASRAIKAAGPRTVPDLINAVADPRYRRKIDPKAREKMHAMMRRAEPLVSVLQCLAEFGPAEAIPAIKHLVRDDCDEVRRQTSLLVGSTGADEAVKLLEACCADEDGYVRSSATIGTLRAIRAGRTTERFRSGAFDAIQPLVYKKCFPDNHNASSCLLGLDSSRAIEYLTRPEHLVAEIPNLHHALYALYEADVKVDPAQLLALAVSLEKCEDRYAYKWAMPALLRHLAHLDSVAASHLIDRATYSNEQTVREAAARTFARRAGLDDPIGYVMQREESGGWQCLTEPQRFTFAAQCLIWEVENGGFSQYFVNSSGNHWPDALAGLDAIGAKTTHDLLRRALAMFGPDGPSTDARARHEQLSSITRKTDKPFDALESAFYKNEDDREVLLLRYMIKHASDFKPAD